MILVDANLLLYAKISTFSEHSKAKPWLDDALNSDTKVGLPWESLNAFIRIATNARILAKPLTIQQAWKQVEEWIGSNQAWIPVATEAHSAVLSNFIPLCKGNSGLIDDAHLAALAQQHGLTIYSADTDFARFKSVKWVNPL